MTYLNLGSPAVETGTNRTHIEPGFSKFVMVVVDHMKRQAIYDPFGEAGARAYVREGEETEPLT